ncbi:aminopeptidase P N-terminal domain-containing protein [Moraxella osloensis]|nr:aminopeptidase P N-terminal domain-containing protein [Moraxella osloensis]UAY36531.1 aminopeptidase P N-terminal domain-containing protein [Moraxella osloensis]
MSNQLTIQLLPKLPQSEFAKRRAKLAEALPNNSIAILQTAPAHIRNNDAEYKYRADSSFFYLTGFTEPESVMVLEKTDHAVNYTLFLREKDKLREIWDGKRVGLEGATADFGADKAIAIGKIDEVMPTLIFGKKHVFARFNNELIGWLNQTKQLQRGEGVVDTVTNIDSLINEMRLIKDESEIARMKVAAQISAYGHIRAMQSVAPLMQKNQGNESRLEAEVNYAFAQYGCVPSYNSIVAGGDNANILHYVENDQPLHDGDLVMIDAGAEYQHYAGDISRTFPVSGKFSDVQKQVYDIVLNANIAAINSLKAGEHGKIHHETALKVLTQGLIELGILTGDVDELIADKAYLPFYMHGTGHWLGLDVHDAGRYTGDDGKPRKLEKGMVITVEPGLYFAHDNALVPKKYRGIGIRIEDDVVITDGDPLVLTCDVPKTTDAIEALMQQKVDL